MTPQDIAYETAVVRPSPAGYQPPFLMAEESDGTVITLMVDAGLHPAIVQPQNWTWVTALPGRIIVDVSLLKVINSPLCGWLINLLRAAPSRCVVVAGANARVRETLRLLKLDTLIPVIA